MQQWLHQTKVHDVDKLKQRIRYVWRVVSLEKCDQSWATADIGKMRHLPSPGNVQG